MSVFGKIWDTVESVIPAIGKVSIIDIGKTVLFAVPEIIEDVTEFVGMAPVEKIDAVCNEIRARTGVEEGAVDVIRDLPADKEDLFFDALAVLIEIIAKNRMKVDGYFVPGEPEADFSAAVAYIQASMSASGPVPGKAAPAAKTEYMPLAGFHKSADLVLGDLYAQETQLRELHAVGEIEYCDYVVAQSILVAAMAQMKMKALVFEAAQ